METRNAVIKYKEEIDKLSDLDTINKLYRHFRIWSYIEECVLGNLTHNERHKLNYQFNIIRIARFEELNIKWHN